MTETGIKTELTYFFRLFQKKLCQWSKKNNFLQQPHDHLPFSDDEGIYCFSDGGSWPVNKASLRYEMNTEAQTGRAIPICFVLKSDEVCSPIARSFPAACDDVWVSPGLVIPNAFCALNASSVLLHMPVAGAHGRLTNGYATARTPLFQSWLIVVHCAVRWKVWLLMLGENLKRKTCALAKKWLFFFFKKNKRFSCRWPQWPICRMPALRRNHLSPTLSCSAFSPMVKMYFRWHAHQHTGAFHWLSWRRRVPTIYSCRCLCWSQSGLTACVARSIWRQWKVEWHR